MIPQVENPHPRAAWFADERIVAAPPFGQFKSEEVRDVGPIITDQDSWPAILGYGFPGSQGVRPSTCLESREALEFGLRQAFLRSEEHTSELQSRPHLVCRLLLEKKKPHQHQSSALSSIRA